MRPLDRKLLRDLWAIKGQAVAISLVIGAGVAMLVMYLSNFDSLRLTQTAFYERSRFADVFASPQAGARPAGASGSPRSPGWRRSRPGWWPTSPSTSPASTSRRWGG